MIYPGRPFIFKENKKERPIYGSNASIQHRLVEVTVLTRIAQRAFTNDGLVSCSAQHVYGESRDWLDKTRHYAAVVETATLSSINEPFLAT